METYNVLPGFIIQHRTKQYINIRNVHFLYWHITVCALKPNKTINKCLSTINVGSGIGTVNYTQYCPGGRVVDLPTTSQPRDH